MITERVIFGSRQRTTPANVVPLMLLLVLLALPLAVQAQPAERVYRIGILGNAPSTYWDEFIQSLRERGYVEGQNVRVERRYVEGRVERSTEFATELIRLQVDILVASGSPAVRAAKRATATIPIVAVLVSDPVAQGLAASLARPGGNVTGLANLLPELGAKRLELLKEIYPEISRVAVLWNPANSGSVIVRKRLTVAARTLGITLHSLEVRSPDDLEGAFALMAKERPDALMTLDDHLFFQHRTSIVDFAAKRRLPAMHASREAAEAGGLVAYIVSASELFRRAAEYTDKILKGAKPGDLPFEQPTKFELVINLRTARALGLTIPPLLMLRASEIIE